MLGTSTGLTITGFILLIPILMLLDFFGANITDDYVVDNMDYAERYKTTLNKAINNGYGYVPLNRILYFYLEDDSLSFYDIYIDNIDKETNKLIEISTICLLTKYKIYSGCKNIENSNQIDVEQNKPFSAPIDFNISSITSFFMQQRIVFGTYGVHKAWDFAAPNQTHLYASCDGIVTKVSFSEKENKTNKEGGGGNEIVITCEIDNDITYKVLYAHLYPSSSKVKVGDIVKSGDIIGEVGTTGYSTGPHLHFEVTFDGKLVDGMSLIDFSK
ncbi:MAG: M23 family metallopeptidase [Bacilli bacterium]|nr:M23 family metallopeptidase [Bacilli bacterium]MDD4808460.1 M23 family metallopeptidase [Bacilli bacterium]